MSSPIRPAFVEVSPYLDEVNPAHSSTKVPPESGEESGLSRRALLAQNAELREQVKHLAEQLELLKRHIFGHKSEKLPAALLAGGIDLFGVEPAPASKTKHIDAHDRSIAPKIGHGRVALPDHLECETTVLEVPEEEKTCPCCGKARVHIGDDVSEQLDIIPPRFIRRRTVRPKLACRQCTECGIAQAQPPVSVIDKGIPSANLVTWIILSKYVDHLPLHRIAGQFKRWGVEIAETTMIGWIAAVFKLLEPIHRAMELEIKSSGCLHVDETTLRVQKGEKDRKGIGKTSVDYLWAMLGRGPDGTPVGVSFLYADGRQHAVARSILENVTGCVLTDGYDAYPQACRGRDDLVHGLCWAHARRKYLEALQCGYGQASQAIQRIGELYGYHHRIQELTSRLARRRIAMGLEVAPSTMDRVILDRRAKWMRPIVDGLEKWNSEMVQSATPKGKFGEAIGYFRNQSARLRQFLLTPRLDLDNNILERAIRPIAVGRKNWLFAGSEEAARRAALLMSVVGTCKLLGIDPAEFLPEVLLRASLRPSTAEACADLTPMRWKLARAK